jgi:hypothetical protein
MGSQFKGPRPARRYVRVPGPFGGHYLGSAEIPVRIYELNVGGGFVNFMHQQPEESRFTVQIELPHEGSITVNAETVYRHQFGIAVRFVDVDPDTSARLARAVHKLIGN